MVKQDESDLTRRTMEEAQYFNKSGTDLKSSSLYRFFMARDADFTIKENPYAKLHPEDVWNASRPHYASYTNRFGDHHQ